MAVEGKKMNGSAIEETEMQELRPENLQNVTGGSIFGDAWSDLKQGADDVGHAAETAGDWVGSEAEKHPVIAVGIGVALVGAGAAAYMAASASEDGAAADVALKCGKTFAENMKDMFCEDE